MRDSPRIYFKTYQAKEVNEGTLRSYGFKKTLKFVLEKSYFFSPAHPDQSMTAF